MIVISISIKYEKIIKENNKKIELYYISFYLSIKKCKIMVPLWKDYYLNITSIKSYYISE